MSDDGQELVNAPSGLCGRPRVCEAGADTTMRVTAEVWREGGPALHVVAETSSGHAALTPDGKTALIAAAGGLVAVPLDGGKARVFDHRPSFFAVAPDSTFAIVPASPHIDRMWRVGVGSVDEVTERWACAALATGVEVGRARIVLLRRHRNGSFGLFGRAAKNRQGGTENESESVL